MEKLKETLDSCTVALACHPVIVCGGRDYSDRVTLFRELDRLRRELRFDKIIHGGAGQKVRISKREVHIVGADLLAGEWAKDRGVTCVAYPARWNLHGKSAGPLRNKAMLKEEMPEAVICFPGGKGTADMMRQADVAGLKVVLAGRK